MNLRVVVSCGRRSRKAMLYARALESAGLEPLLLAPPEQRTLREIGAAGLLLSGGTDLDPGLYGEERGPYTEMPDFRRDRMERRLLREALDQDLPVLGICRGMQFLNVYHGGTLVQHHSHQVTHRVRTPDPGLPAHTVIIQPSSCLADILGEGRCEVNSRHHQAARRVSYRLAVSARAPDGTVEALERKDKAFVVGVQWHPEDMTADRRQRRLFEAFARKLRES